LDVPDSHLLAKKMGDFEKESNCVKSEVECNEWADVSSAAKCNEWVDVPSFDKCNEEADVPSSKCCASVFDYSTIPSDSENIRTHTSEATAIGNQYLETMNDTEIKNHAPEECGLGDVDKVASKFITGCIETQNLSQLNETNASGEEVVCSPNLITLDTPPKPHQQKKSKDEPQYGCISKGSADNGKGVIDFQCGICDKIFHYRKSFQGHVADHVVAISFVCDICNLSDNSEAKMKKHVASTHANKNSIIVHCLECKVDVKESVFHHVKNHHPLLFKAVFGKTSFSQPTKSEEVRSKKTHSYNSFNNDGNCVLCNCTLLKIETEAHVLNYHAEVSYHCAVCDDVSPSMKTLLLHVKEMHGKCKGENANDKLLLECGLCLAKETADKFIGHLDGHFEDMATYQYDLKECHTCNFKHVSQSRLDAHLWKVHAIKPMNNERCESLGRPTEVLSLSKSIGTKSCNLETKLKCKSCEFQTSHKVVLDRHLLKAHGPLRCLECFKKFKHQHAFQLHQSIAHDISK